jgi:Uri superfamily endonuclease
MSIPVVVLAAGPWSGAYVLHIWVSHAESIVFGRFHGGAEVVVEPGDYLYIGSARGVHGRPILARRVLRHLTRTGNRPPQPLRTTLLTYLRDHGWPEAGAPATKTLRWHIDYLLDTPSAAVTYVLLIRGQRTTALPRTWRQRPPGSHASPALDGR